MQTSISTTQLAFSSLVSQQNGPIQNQRIVANQQDADSETAGYRTSRFIEVIGAI